MNENYPDVNVAAQRADGDSIWHYYRRLIDLRHDETVFVYGEYDLLLPDDESFYAYIRTLDGEAMLVVLNWSDWESVFDCGAVDTADATVVVGNAEDPPIDPRGRDSDRTKPSSTDSEAERVGLPAGCDRSADFAPFPSNR